jgi:hypothetical protein
MMETKVIVKNAPIPGKLISRVGIVRPFREFVQQEIASH